MKKNKGNWFKYIVIIGVLLIPFMYSFFYLKAYWDPYGKMSDIPVAIVNEDIKVDGESKSDDLVNTLKEKNTLNIDVVSKKAAIKGLNNKKYYAVITIPKDFTSDLLSANTTDKSAATITYSPNQKTNYLASQIINRVVLEVEKNVRSEVSKEVVSTLTDNLNNTSSKVDEINDGISKIQNGTSKISDGSSSLNKGMTELNTKYKEFDAGVNLVGNGSKDLYVNMELFDSKLEELKVGVNNLSDGISKLKMLEAGIQNINTNESAFDNGLQTYVSSVNDILSKATSNPAILTTPIIDLKNATCNNQSPLHDLSYCEYFTGISIKYQDKISNNVNYTLVNLLVDSGNEITKSSNSLKLGINQISNSANSVDDIIEGTTLVKDGVSQMKDASTKLLNGSKELSNGTNMLNNSSKVVFKGIGSLADGTNTLYNGATELNNGVITSRNQISKELSSSKGELSKLDKLDEYTQNPVIVKEDDVNEVSEYGTAFSPFFMSIALWVGSLMLFIILYYDAEDRFKYFSRNAENKVKRTACYLLLASIQGIILGVLLKLGLNLNITNNLLYFGSLILVACLFESIMEFLIVNFKDIGKFLALILLVLQLAATGGTFPIQTVSSGFQKLFNFLPMKYTIDLFKECLISIESNLLSKPLIIIIVTFVVLLIINVIVDIIKQRKAD